MWLLMLFILGNTYHVEELHADVHVKDAIYQISKGAFSHKEDCLREAVRIQKDINIAYPDEQPVLVYCKFKESV